MGELLTEAPKETTNQPSAEIVSGTTELEVDRLNRVAYSTHKKLAQTQHIQEKLAIRDSKKSEAAKSDSKVSFGTRDLLEGMAKASEDEADRAKGAVERQIVDARSFALENDGELIELAKREDAVVGRAKGDADAESVLPKEAAHPGLVQVEMVPIPVEGQGHIPEAVIPSEGRQLEHV